MPHSTSDQTTRRVSPSVMTAQDSAIPKRDGRITSGGFSLFPGQAGQQPPPSEERSDTVSVDGRDPAQIEAALGILNEPRVDTMTMTNNSSGERGDNDGRAMSPDEGRKLTQYFEDQFAYKDGHVGSARERIQKDSPIIAELRTNVIVCAAAKDIVWLFLTRSNRSKMNSHWSQTCRIIYRQDTLDQNQAS